MVARDCYMTATLPLFRIEARTKSDRFSAPVPDGVTKISVMRSRRTLSLVVVVGANTGT